MWINTDELQRFPDSAGNLALSINFYELEQQAGAESQCDFEDSAKH
jgi:hypothetical protein